MSDRFQEVVAPLLGLGGPGCECAPGDNQPGRICMYLEKNGWPERKLYGHVDGRRKQGLPERQPWVLKAVASRRKPELCSKRRGEVVL